MLHCGTTALFFPWGIVANNRAVCILEKAEKGSRLSAVHQEPEAAGEVPRVRRICQTLVVVDNPADHLNAARAKAANTRIKLVDR